MSKYCGLLLSFGLVLSAGLAEANVDISALDKVEVGSWGDLKDALADSDNAGKAIVLTGNITADANNPIDTVVGSGIVIDGGGFTITGQDGTSKGQFIQFDSSDTTDLIIQNVKIENFADVQNSSSAYGGAIYLKGGSLGDISADFSGNSATQSGAIYNGGGKIGNITGDFSNNKAQSVSSFAAGGAIVNEEGGEIGNINGNFIGNIAQSNVNAAAGAIYNMDKIGNITGDFINNSAQGGNKEAYSGALNNHGEIGDIKGDFIGNFAKSEAKLVFGGAIINNSIIKSITGDFANNYVSGADYAIAGALINMSGANINKLEGDFFGNYAESTTNYARGGAIDNEGGSVIESIVGSFYKNHADGYTYAVGGAIANKDENSEIGNIEGNFEGNYAKSSSGYAQGGAIYNTAKMGDITGDFRDNSAISEATNAQGGAIYNKGEIGDIKGDFEGNAAQGIKKVEGGAIYNESGAKIGNIAGDFENNSAIQGGAIYNKGGEIGNITGDFSNNKVQSDSLFVAAGVIANEGIIGDITGDFVGNTAASVTNAAAAGAIYTSNKIGNITGDFINNSAQTSDLRAYGGAILNQGEIGDIKGDFIGNFAKSEKNYVFGGAIINNSIIKSITGDLTKNYVSSANSAFGGALINMNSANINKLEGDFQNNYVESTASFARGGAIENDMASVIESIVGSFYNNHADGYTYALGGAIANINENSEIGNIEGNFEGNYAHATSEYARGGAIYNSGDPLTLVNSSFKGNYVETGAAKDSDDGQQTQGGAIYSLADLTIKADNGNSIFSGNKVKWADGEDSSAIYLAGSSGNKLYLDVINNGLIQFDDKIAAASDASSIAITGDESSKVVFNNTLDGFGTIDISGTNVDINAGAGSLAGLVTHDGGVLNVNNGAVAEDIIINTQGGMNVNAGGTANRNNVEDGGVLHVATNGVAQNTTVNSGGQLITEDKATVNNLLANDGSNLNIDAGSYLVGNIILHAGAIMEGTYDYSQIFKDDVSGTGSLTLVGGLNDILTENSLINTTAEKKLNLTAGTYAIGDGVQTVKGWDMLKVKDNATVKLEGNIELTGPNKKLIVENGSTLDLAGHSPSNYTITGSVSNDGLMTFTHSDDEADDVTTIYGNYKAYNNAKMSIDVDPINNVSDLLRIDGDVEGKTDVILNSTVYEGKPTALIKFVEAQNDDLTTGAAFDIYRVENSAYEWNSLYKDGAWYTGTTDLIPDGSESGYGDINTGNMEDDEDLESDAVLLPNFPSQPSSEAQSGNPRVVGEAIAYMGLPSAGIEQTRSMMQAVSDKVSVTKVYYNKCYGFYDYGYNYGGLSNAWVNPVYSYSKVKSPYDYEAEISGLEAGFDIQSDVNNRLGVFASFRQGEYDFDGRGDDYMSKVGSTIDIDSYILGLYHRYDAGKAWVMSQVFAGYQDVDFASDDGVSSDTDGVEFGGSVAMGWVFNPWRGITLEPIARLSYTQINYDNAKDRYGKTAKFSDVRNVEIEGGLRLEKSYNRRNGYAKIYFQPSIIQNIGSGDVTVTSLSKVHGLENSTLGRVAIGGSMSFDDKWSGFANTSYTFGSDYNNLMVNMGVNYAF